MNTHRDRESHNNKGKKGTNGETSAQSKHQHISFLSHCVQVSSARFQGIVALSEAALRGTQQVLNQQLC